MRVREEEVWPAWREAGGRDEDDGGIGGGCAWVR